MERGYWKFWRKTSDYGFFRHENHSFLAFWVWCLNNASWKQKTIFINGRSVDLKQGEFVMALRTSSKELGLSIQTIRTFLTRLESHKMLTLYPTHHYTLVSIVNWDTYQSNELPINTQDNTQLTHDQHTLNTDIRKKERKNKILSPILTDDFRCFYTSYPRKIDKLGAWKAWQKISPNNGLVEKIMTALSTDKAGEWKGQEIKYIPHPATWLNRRRWEDDEVKAEPPDLLEYLKRGSNGTL